MSNGNIEGLLTINTLFHPDYRGCFSEIYKASRFPVDVRFLQDNISVSRKNVLRGLHFQKPPMAQAKLVRVLSGRAWSVAVDLRSGSKTYGNWHGVELSPETGLAFYIPEGFAHGFVALEDETILFYKCSAEYAPESEAGIRWDDPDLAIDWPIRNVIVSPKDASLPYLKDIQSPF